MSVPIRDHQFATSSPRVLEVRLSDFQRMMLYWDAWWPFQVVDTVELSGIVDAEELRLAAETVLDELGIANYQIDSRRGRCRYRSGPAHVEVNFLDGTGDRQAHLERHVSAELTRRFTLNVDPLVRFWILSGDDSYTVGMTWQHWFADGVTAAELLRRVLEHMRGTRTIGPDVLLGFQPPCGDPFFRHRGLAWRCEEIRQVLLATIAGIGVRRMRPSQSPELRAKSRILTLPDDCLVRLLRVSRRAGMTLNDLLIAALARAVHDAKAAGPSTWFGSRIRIINMVDLRPYADISLRGVGGQYLALMTAEIPTSLLRDVSKLLDHIHRHTSNVKQKQLFFAARLGFLLGRWILDYTPRSWRSRTISNTIPMTALITNLRLSTPWDELPLCSSIRKYQRFLPPNLSSPVVLGITTNGDELTATITVRSDDIRVETVASILESNIVALIDELSDS